jgi:hypothetical protein
MAMGNTGMLAMMQKSSKTILWILAGVVFVGVATLGASGFFMAIRQQIGSDTVISKELSPDKKWLVEIHDHSDRMDLLPIVNIWVKSTARPRYFYWRGDDPNVIVYSRRNGCAPSGRFHAEWSSASRLMITYPECVPGAYRTSGDDTEIVRMKKWKDIDIAYQAGGWQ